MEHLKTILQSAWDSLDKVPVRYLNESGIAAKEAYQCVLWYAEFYDDLDEFANSEQFLGLFTIPDRAPEFYKRLGIIKAFIQANLERDIES